MILCDLKIILTSNLLSLSLLPAPFYKFCRISEWHFTDRHPSVLCSTFSESTACRPAEGLMMSGSASWRAAGCLQLWRCSSSCPPASAALTAPQWSTTSTLFTMLTTEVRPFALLKYFRENFHLKGICDSSWWVHNDLKIVISYSHWINGGILEKFAFWCHF